MRNPASRKRSAAKGDAEGSQVERCYRILRETIVSCEIAPGERFTERELMARSGFGRTPLREALLRLSQEGLVTALPRSGYEVTPVTEKTVNDLFHVWRPVGPLIVRLAFERMTPKVRREIRQIAKGDMTGAPPHQNSQYSSRLFETLVAATQNDDIVYIWRRLSANMTRMFIIFFSTEMGAAWGPRPGELDEIARSTDPDEVAAWFAGAIARAHEGILQVIKERAQVSAEPKVSGSRKARATKPPATAERAGPRKVRRATADR